MTVKMNDIKSLRKATGAGVMDAKRALEESKGDMSKARAWIAKKGIVKAQKKADRDTGSEHVFSYVHYNGRVGALLKLACETDFVAKTEDFQKLGKELVMQVASMMPEEVEGFMNQDYLRDPSKKIKDLVKKTSAKVGENIRIIEFSHL